MYIVYPNSDSVFFFLEIQIFFFIIVGAFKSVQFKDPERRKKETELPVL